MKAFMYYNPTKLLFGNGQLNELPKQLQAVGKNILLVYGSGSIKQNGIYETITGMLEASGKRVTELAGVEPNPRLTTVEKGAKLCKDNDIDFVLAVGGGSVIDCTKAIVACAKMDEPAWDIICRKVRATSGLPYGSIVTIAGTGAEMSLTSVITNWETNEKRPFSSSYSRAQFTIVDPLLTRSVPRKQTIYGIVDTMSHLLEHYFHREANTPIQDRMLEAVMQSLLELSPSLLNDLENEDLRETVTYASTIALSDQLSMGLLGDWGTHHIDHALSAIFDIPHGAGMGILFPHWMNFIREQGQTDRLVLFAKHVCQVKTDQLNEDQIAKAGIQALQKAWSSWGAPSQLRAFAIPFERLDEVAELTVRSVPVCGNYFTLNKQAILQILQAAY